MLANAKLGITLKTEGFDADHEVGVRYWTLADDGKLGAPIGSSAHWMPGLNRAHCQTDRHFGGKGFATCGCGLYCFAYRKDLGQTCYFNFDTATPNGTPGAGVVGGLAYWHGAVKSTGMSPGGFQRARFGCVAALMMPKGATDAVRKRIQRAADFYQVEIVAPKDLKTAVDSWVENVLPTFYTPEVLPLFDILGKALPQLPQERQVVLQTRDRRSRAVLLAA